MSELQAVIFPKTEFTSAQADEWLRKFHITPMKREHVTKNYRRYRIRDPDQYDHFAIKDEDSGVKLVIGFKTKKKAAKP